MGRARKTNTLKMKQRKSQAKKKARVARKIKAAKK
jgi:hypothetical protein